MSSKNQYIIVVGCGRLGVLLANRLSRSGHSIVAIDRDERKFGGLSAEFSGFRLLGDATELPVLRQAKTDQADKLIAVTRDDNVNLAVAQVAREIFRVPVVVARVWDTERVSVFENLGIQTVCPLILASNDLLRQFGETVPETTAETTAEGGR